jgi:hypothetical protein
LRKQDVLLWDAQHCLIPVDSPLARLQQATAISLTLANQKSGRRDQSRRHNATGQPLCPVRAVVRRLHHLYGNPPSTLLSTIHLDPTTTAQVQPQLVTSLLHLAVHDTGLQQNGFPRDRVSSHSIRASGATALKLNGVSDSDIQTLGRWSSQTFLLYIQVQLAAVASATLATRMIHYIPFYNVTPNR